ncbi:ABC transporter substrate-binding protein [soil metagenome]
MPSRCTARRRRLRLPAALLTLGLVGAACGGGNGGEPIGQDADEGAASAEEGAPEVGGSITFGLESAVDSVDPANEMAQPADKAVGLAIYDPLVSFDDQGGFVPYLAESFESNEELTVWTVTLPADVQFHDGSPFNAAAVKAQFDRLLDPATNCTCLPNIDQITGIEIPDEATVVFTLEAPNVAFPVILAGPQGWIASPTAVAALGNDGYDRAPVGTGPFVMADYANLVVEKNPDYWRTDGEGTPLPYLDSIDFEEIPDTGTRLQAVQAGDIDIMQTADTDTVVAAEEAGLEVQEVTGSSSTILFFNTTQPPFDDVTARRAVAFGMNRDRANQIGYEGARTESYSPFAPGYEFFTEPDPEFPRYDPEQASALVEEYEAEKGPLAFEVTCIPTPEADQILQLLQQDMAEIGIEVTLNSLDQGQFVPLVFGKSPEIEAGCFRGPQIADPDQLYDTLFSGAGGNISQYSNPTVDEALTAGRSSADTEIRKDAYATVIEELAEDVPVIPTLYDLYGNVHRSEVHGLPSPENNALGAIKPTTLWVEQ